MLWGLCRGGIVDVWVTAYELSLKDGLNFERRIFHSLFATVRSQLPSYVRNRRAHDGNGVRTSRRIKRLG